jgi:DegV family protein with EDD domain
VKKLGLIVDSTCDLPVKEIEQYDIGIVPVSVYFPNETRTQYIDLTSEEFFEKIVEEDLHCTTGVPPPKRFIHAINTALEKYEQIIMLCLSNELSGLWSSGVLHANNLAPERITVVDIRTTTIAYGLIVLKVARLIQNGGSKEQVLRKLSDEIIPNSRLNAFVGTLKYLKRSGRIATLQHILGELLHFKPLIEILDGKLESPMKVRGSKAAFEYLVKLGKGLMTALPEKDTIIIAHSRNSERATELAQIIQKSNLKNIEILIWEIGPAVGVHVGPGALGFTWIGNHQNEILNEK